MRVIRSACIAVTLAFGAVLVPAQKSVEEFTFRITAELEAVNPEAAQIFRQANEARDRLEFGEAEDLYRRVMALAPGFIHAKRRLAWMALFQGRRDEALRLTGEILPVDDSSENRAARIGALLDAETPKLTEIKEAVRHAEEMMGAFALDWTLLPFVCEAAIADQNQLLLSRCVTRLQRTAPYEIATYLYGWTLDLANGHHKQAKEKLDLAREAGLDEEAYDELSATTRSARPPLVRLASFGWRLGAVWLGGLLTLLALGITLSRMTLRAATQVAGAPSGAPVGLSATLRNFYRGVLWATCSYYFLSLPIVVLAVIGLGAAALLFILSLELIPIKLVALIIGVVAVTVIAVVRSLFIRPPEMDPGELLDMETQPKLRGVLDEVALEIDTRPVDNVYLTPGTDLAVMERGGVFRQMRGTSERCLILGVGVLDDMRVGPFKAILGHEYGHFSNRDTAGGGFALAVTRSIHLTAEGLAEGGAGGIFNTQPGSS